MAPVRLTTLFRKLITLTLSFDQISGKGSSAQLGLANLGGVFIVLLGGMFISIIVAIFEFAWKRRKLLVDENVRLTMTLKIRNPHYPRCFRSLFFTRCGRTSSSQLTGGPGTPSQSSRAPPPPA